MRNPETSRSQLSAGFEYELFFEELGCPQVNHNQHSLVYGSSLIKCQNIRFEL
jgi:hypothetical protein